MQRKRPQPKANTRQKLLGAAARVFARDGLTGATTRAIAQEAGVNEVTLFRHFQSKERLISAVVGEEFGTRAPASQIVVPTPTDNLHGDLVKLARLYEALLTANWPLVRTMLGEMHHHLTLSHEKQVMHAILMPLKEALISRVKTAQGAGEVQPNQRADLLADLLFGTIFTAVLRRSLAQIKIEYSPAEYLETAVSMFLNGVSLRQGRS